MKLLVIGQPRSRSNYLLDSLATHHGIDNLYEPYIRISQKNPQMYYDNVIPTTARLVASNESFACKLQTTDMLGNYTNFAPLTTFHGFDFTIFDSIYITYRKNLTDQLCSLIVAQETGKFSFVPGVPNKEFQPVAHKSFTFDPEKHYIGVRGLFLDTIKTRFAKKFLDSIGKSYTVVEYENAGKWINANLPNGVCKRLDSQFNYREIFTNYNEVTDFLDILGLKN